MQSSGGVALYSSPSGSWVQTDYSTVDRIIQAAEQVGDIRVVFSNTWTPDTSFSKCDVPRMNKIFLKSQSVIDDVWSKFGTSRAFGGWYIAQEIDDSDFPSCQASQFIPAIGSYYQEMSNYMKAKNASKPIYIAPSTTASVRGEDFKSMWQSILSQASSVNSVILQDGVGQLRSDADVDVVQYGRIMKQVTDSLGRTSGFTVELFDTKNPALPSVSYPPASFNSIVDRLRVDGGISSELYGFHWFDLTGQTYSQYRDYVNAIHPLSQKSGVPSGDEKEVGNLASTGVPLTSYMFVSTLLIVGGFLCVVVYTRHKMYK